MKRPLLNITDLKTLVYLLVYLKGGGHMTICTNVEQARNALKEWKKFILFYSIPSNERSKDRKDEPFVIFHFLEGSMDACASVVFPDVSGMQYVEIPEADGSEKYYDALGKMADAMKKQMENESESDKWKKPPFEEGGNT